MNKQKQIDRIGNLLNDKSLKTIINVKARFKNDRIIETIKKENVVDAFEIELLYSALHRKKGFCSLEIYVHACRNNCWMTERAVLETDEDFFYFFYKVEI